MQRRLLLVTAVLGLGGCGFALRQPPSFAFRSIFVAAAPTSPFGLQLRRTIESTGQVTLLPESQQTTAQVILDLLDERREKVVVGLNVAGQVREFQLRQRLRFRLRTPGGKELIAPTELLQQRDISFNEQAVLSKEAEENLLYRDMQNDLVQQLMRRLAAVRDI